MKKDALIDQKRVKDDHQEGIKRVMQRKGDMVAGQQGRMSNKPRTAAQWKRPDNTSPPVGA